MSKSKQPPVSRQAGRHSSGEIPDEAPANFSAKHFENLNLRVNSGRRIYQAALEKFKQRLTYHISKERCL